MKKSGKSWGEAFTEISGELQGKGFSEEEAQRKAGFLMGSYYGQGTVSTGDANDARIKHDLGTMMRDGRVSREEAVRRLQARYGFRYFRLFYVRAVSYPSHQVISDQE